MPTNEFSYLSPQEQIAKAREWLGERGLRVNADNLNRAMAALYGLPDRETSERVVREADRGSRREARREEQPLPVPPQEPLPTPPQEPAAAQAAQQDTSLSAIIDSLLRGDISGAAALVNEAARRDLAEREPPSMLDVLPLPGVARGARGVFPLIRMLLQRRALPSPSTGTALPPPTTMPPIAPTPAPPMIQGPGGAMVTPQTTGPAVSPNIPVINPRGPMPQTPTGAELARMLAERQERILRLFGNRRVAPGRARVQAPSREAP